MQSFRKLIVFAKVGIGRLISEILLLVSVKLGRCLVKPVRCRWLMSELCNFQCRICHQWERGLKEKKDELVSVSEIERIIDELARWGVSQFSVSGGEPLLDYEKLMDVLEYANKRGLFTSFVTNGFLLTESTIMHYDGIGGGYITLSIDGLASSHDIIRKEGSFVRCIGALEAYKKLRPKNVRMKITTVMTELNLGDILEVVSIAEKYHVPIFIQPYQIYFDSYDGVDPLWIPGDRKDKLLEVINKLLELKKENPSLIINPIDHLEGMPAYFLGGGLNKGHRRRCLIAYSDIPISPNGDVKICKFGKVGNVRKQNLKSIWYSSVLRNIRKDALDCQYKCMVGCFIRFSPFQLIKLGINWLLQSP